MPPTPADHPKLPNPSAEVDATRLPPPSTVTPQTGTDASRLVAPTLPDKELANVAIPPTLAPLDSQPGSTGATPGVRHIGQYELLAELGRGGMGVVYKARDTKLMRLAAIKVLRGRDLDPDEALRFRHEAEAMARVQHPGVVQVFEVGEHDGKPFLAMEYCEGGGLDRYLSGTPLPPKEAAALVERLAEAVQAAHDQHILHRDLKPANVLIAGSKQPSSESSTAPGGDSGSQRTPVSTLAPKVSDFGLAKRLDAVGPTQSNAVMGTPPYMAPEQARGDSKKATAATDVYALGAILYECLTGRPPFKAATAMDTLLLVLEEEPVPPRRLQPQTPHDVETVCLKCLHKEPQRRYGSARELAEDLQRYRNGEAIRARSAGPIERGWRWCRRNPAVAGLMLLVSVLLLAGTIVATLLALYANQAAVRADQERINAVTQEGLARTGEAEALKQKRIAEKKTNELEIAQSSLNTALTDSRKTTRSLAVATLGYAASEVERGELVHARQLLDQIPPPNRGWEWGYLRKMCTGGSMTLYGHTASVESVAYSPDGQLLATGSEDGTVKVWDTRTGQLLFPLLGNTSSVYSITFSADGKRLATGNGDGSVRVYDANSGDLLLRLDHPLSVRSVAFSPDGQWLASGCSDETVRVWDLLTGKLLPLSGHTGYVSSVAFSPDGKRLASGGLDGTVRLWDTRGGKLLLALPGHSDRVQSVAFSPDGLHLASGSWDNTVKVWDLRTAKLSVSLLGHTKRVYSVCFSPDGQRLASGGWDRNVKVWDLSGQSANLKSRRTYR